MEGVVTVHIATCGLCKIRTMVEVPTALPEDWSQSVRVDSVQHGHGGYLFTAKLACGDCVEAMHREVAEAVEQAMKERAGSRDGEWIGEMPGESAEAEMEE